MNAVIRRSLTLAALASLTLGLAACGDKEVPKEFTPPTKPPVSSSPTPTPTVDPSSTPSDETINEKGTVMELDELEKKLLAESKLLNAKGAKYIETGGFGGEGKEYGFSGNYYVEAGGDEITVRERDTQRALTRNLKDNSITVRREAPASAQMNKNVTIFWEAAKDWHAKHKDWPTGGWDMFDDEWRIEAFGFNEKKPKAVVLPLPESLSLIESGGSPNDYSWTFKDEDLKEVAVIDSEGKLTTYRTYKLVS